MKAVATPQVSYSPLSGFADILRSELCKLRSVRSTYWTLGAGVVFSRIDHAAAAKDAGLTMRPRTVIVFGNPKAGTPQMTKSGTLAIDLPMKALVWQDDADKVWLTYNASEYSAKEIYPRHGLTVPDEAAQALAKFLADVGDQSTQ